MKRLLYLAPLAVVLGVLGLAVGLPRADAVIGGTADSTHPSVGVMYLDWPFMTGFCSGSLIAPHEFLVAGHCTRVFDADPALLSHAHVSFDQTVSLTAAGAITSLDPVDVVGWTTHPHWSVQHNDVGVLDLDPNVDLGLTPVNLPPVGFLDQKRNTGDLAGHTFTLSGYGLNGVDRFFYSPQAHLIFEGQRESGPIQFQALTQDRLHDYGGGCGGDSGAPYFYNGNDPNSVVVAVGSTGPGSCVGPESSQRLDTQSVHAFLEGFTQH
jgi:Trypsin